MDTFGDDRRSAVDISIDVVLWAAEDLLRPAPDLRDSSDIEWPADDMRFSAAICSRADDLRDTGSTDELLGSISSYEPRVSCDGDSNAR